MITKNEILNALTEAINAYNINPELLVKIAELETMVELYKDECETKDRRIVDLKDMNDRIYDERDTLRDQVTKLESEASELHLVLNRVKDANADQGVYIGNLVSDKDTLKLRLEIAHADNEALKARLNDAQTIGDRLKSMIKGFMSEVSPEVETLPASGVAHSSPFLLDAAIGSVDYGRGNDFTSQVTQLGEVVHNEIGSISAKSLVETTEVDDKVTAESADRAWETF